MRLGGLFTDHAILQQNTSIPIWGWTTPWLTVTCTLGNEIVKGIAGGDGFFLVRFPAMKVSPAPLQLRVTVASTEEQIIINDILIGEVWLATGQSNMQWPLKNTGESIPRALLEGSINELRFFTVPYRIMPQPTKDINGKWEKATQNSILDFSAVAFHFAEKIHRELNVPVGIIVTAKGATRIESWMSREALLDCENTRAWVSSSENELNSEQWWQHHSRLDFNCPEEQLHLLRNSHYPQDHDNIGIARNYHSPDFDDHDWKTIMLPCSWRQNGNDFNGILWFRYEFEISDTVNGENAYLNLGRIDKHDQSFLNGELIGRTGENFDIECYNKLRRYQIPSGLLHKGRNVVAVRVYSFVLDGGLIGPADKMFLEQAQETKIALSGRWKYQIEQNFGIVKSIEKQKLANLPHVLFDGMIHPLIPYAIRGFIIYHGETNAKINPSGYEQLLNGLVDDWRYRWGLRECPFIVVQLANFHAASAYQSDSSWAIIRECQRHILKNSGCGLVVTIDIGDSDNLHPNNKYMVGLRLAVWALNQVYGFPYVPSGPLFKKMRREKRCLRLYFSYAESGLISRGSAICWYISENGRDFKQAKMQIDKETVLLENDTIANPYAVRYAWADNPQNTDLYNIDGLPASPFQAKLKNSQSNNKGKQK